MQEWFVLNTFNVLSLCKISLVRLLFTIVLIVCFLAEVSYQYFIQMERYREQVNGPETVFKSCQQKTINCITGNRFLNTSAFDMERNTKEIIAYRGKIMQIKLWFGNCDPCSSNIPITKKLKETYEEVGRVFLSSIRVVSDIHKG